MQNASLKQYTPLNTVQVADEYKGVKFGLFAAEIITAEDGTEIPKDGLLEVISIGENGNGVFSVDIPIGSGLHTRNQRR